MEKTCIKCRETKLFSEFTKDSRRKDKLNQRCKICCKTDRDTYYLKNRDKIKIKHDTWRQENIEYIKSKKKQKRIEDPRYSMFYAAKHRAKKNNLEFNISVDDIIIPEYCPVLKIKLEMFCNSQSRTSPSLDRIDSSKGYILGNIQVISWLANTMKSNATYQELSDFAEWVIKEIKPRINNVR